MSRLGVIEAEPEARCEMCGKIAELCPYGPNSERICFACGMKDEEITKRQFSRVVLGEPVN